MHYKGPLGKCLVLTRVRTWGILEDKRSLSSLWQELGSGCNSPGWSPRRTRHRTQAFALRLSSVWARPACRFPYPRRVRSRTSGSEWDITHWRLCQSHVIDCVLAISLCTVHECVIMSLYRLHRLCTQTWLTGLRLQYIYNLVGDRMALPTNDTYTSPIQDTVIFILLFAKLSLTWIEITCLYKSCGPPQRTKIIAMFPNHRDYF